MASTQSTLKKIPGYGADQSQENRPGVPMEALPPSGTLSAAPIPHQIQRVRVLKRVGLEKLTPVFGSAQPPRGLSGLLRKAAYKIPESRASHWGLLLFADRVDVAEGVVSDAFVRKPYVGIWALAGGLGLIAFAAKSRTRKSIRRK